MNNPVINIWVYLLTDFPLAILENDKYTILYYLTYHIQYII